MAATQESRSTFVTPPRDPKLHLPEFVERHPNGDLTWKIRYGEDSRLVSVAALEMNDLLSTELGLLMKQRTQEAVDDMRKAQADALQV